MSKTERGQCMVMCLDCMYLMTERSDEQVTECAACGRDDCLADGIDLAEIVERWNKTNWRDLYAARDLLAACKKNVGILRRSLDEQPWIYEQNAPTRLCPME